MNILKPVLIIAAAVAIGACGEGDRSRATAPETLMRDANAGSVNAPSESSASAARFPACVQPSNQGLGPNEIAPGCYTVCTDGAGAHTGASGKQTGRHLQMGDGVEIGQVKQLTLVNIRPKKVRGEPERPDEQWPMLGSANKTRIEGARAFKHTNPDTTTVAVPHTITISKVPAADKPEDCRKNNVIEIKFCTDMVVTNAGATSTRFLCSDPSPAIPGPDQGHVHAEN